jgi:hypothetical protein
MEDAALTLRESRHTTEVRFVFDFALQSDII